MANEFKIKKGLIVNGSGSTILDIQGSQGQLFSVTDQLSGSLFSVNDISGIPIMEVFSDNTVNLGTFNAEAIKVSGSFATMTGSLFGTASWADNATTASYALTAGNATSATTAINANTASNITPAITNDGDNRVLTSNGGGTINGEANLSFNGSQLSVGASNTGDVLAGIYYAGNGTATNPSYTFHTDYSTGMFRNFSDSSLNFTTNGSTKLTILSTGNVGIGTTSPSHKLDVNSYTSRFGEGTHGHILISDDYYGGELGIITDSDESIAIKYNDGTFRYGGPNPGAETLIISGSSVGIGTSSPSAKLEVNGTININSIGDRVFIADPSVGTFSIGDLDGLSDEAQIVGDASTIKINNAGNTTLTATFNNRIGIGTTNPSEKLHISSGNLRLESSGIKDTNNSSGSAGQVLKSNNSGEVEWGWVPNTLVSSFLHTQNISGAAYFLPFNTTGEAPTNQYYNFFIAPYSGRVRKMIIKYVNGSTPSATSFSTFRVVINGTQYDFTPTTTGGGTTSMQGVYTFNDNDVVFSEGDKVQFAFITAGGTGLVQGCSATVLIEYSQI